MILKQNSENDTLQAKITKIYEITSLVMVLFIKRRNLRVWD
jgi:hypothetical protein